MISKTILIKGAVGAAAIYAARAFKLPVLNDLVGGPTSDGTTLPIPAVAPKNGYGLEWALAPAVVALYLSR